MNPKVWPLKTWMSIITMITTPIFIVCSLAVPWGPIEHFQGLVNYYWYPYWLGPAMLSTVAFFLSMGVGMGP